MAPGLLGMIALLLVEGEQKPELATSLQMEGNLVFKLGENLLNLANLMAAVTFILIHTQQAQGLPIFRSIVHLKVLGAKWRITNFNEPVI